MFPGQSVVLTWFSRWFKLLVGISTLGLQVLTWLVKICLLVVASPSILLCHSKIPSDWTVQSPLQFPVWWGQNRAFHNAREFCCHLWVLFFHWRNQWLMGERTTWCCTGLEEKQCGQLVAVSLTLLMQSVLFSVMRGCFSLTSMFDDSFSGSSFVNSC